MGFSAHRGTTGHTIGAQVIGKDNPTGTSPKASGNLPGLKFSDMSVKPAQNGITVRHTPPLPQGTKEYSESAPQEQLHVFRDAEEAHNHIGELLGVRMGSGQRRD